MSFSILSSNKFSFSSTPEWQKITKGVEFHTIAREWRLKWEGEECLTAV